MRKVALNRAEHWFGNLQIKSKMLIMLLLSTAFPIVVMGFSSFGKIIEMTKNESNTYFTSIVEQTTNNLDRVFSNLRENAEFIYGDTIIPKILKGESIYSIDSMDEKNEIIYQKISINKNAGTCILSTTGEIYWYNMSFYPDLSTDFRKTNEYSKCKSNGYKLTWIPTDHISLEASISPEKKTDTMAAVMVLKDFNTGEEVGLLEIVMNEKSIYDVYNEVKMTPNSYGFILDPDGYIISHENKGILGKRNAVYSHINNIIRNKDSGSFTYSMNNKKYMLLFNTLHTNNWKIVFAIPMDELLMYSESAKHLIIRTTILCAVILLLMSMLISGGIATPIENMASVITRIGEGDFSARISRYGKRNDEIGIMAKEINTMARKITRLINENIDSMLKTKEAELGALQAQIDPHFLYNTLDTIYFLAIKQNSSEIGSIALALGDLMRISINTGKNLITIKEEITYIENYMVIQKIRFKDKVNLEVNIEEEIYSKMIPKLTLQPLVENAMVHGIEEKMGKGKITISGFQKGDCIILKVADDGVGLDEEYVNNMLSFNLENYKTTRDHDISLLLESESYNKRGSHVGLKNVDLRIKLIYGDEYGISVRSKKGLGTTVYMRIRADENSLMDLC